MKKAVATTAAPAAIGPYSQAVRAGDWLFLSGQLGLDPVTGAFVPGDAAAQAKQALANLSAVLKAAGADPSKVVKTTIFLKDLGDFSKVNEVYGAVFAKEPPARSTVQAARLPKEALVEIEAIAFLG